MQNRTLIVIPTYNESENIEILISKFNDLDNKMDILFIDDNSPDKTSEIIKKFTRKFKNINLIVRPKKLGVGSAHLDGIIWAYDNNYDTVITMDSDLTHSPEIIIDFINSSNDIDILVGSRFKNNKSLKDWSFHRFIITHFGHILTKLFLSLPYDATGGFRVYNIKNINKNIFYLPKSTGYAFIFEILFFLHIYKYKIAEKEIMLPKRTYGNSKMRISDIFHSIKMLLFLFLQKITYKKDNNLVKKFYINNNLLDKERYEWDTYWSEKKNIINFIYSLIAIFYRKFIIKPTLNYFINKHFNKNSLLLHAGSGGGQVDTDISKNMQVIALDISTQALLNYQKNHSVQNKIVHGSIFNLNFDNKSLDGIFNLGVMEHFEPYQVKEILNQFNNKLKKNGKVVLFWPPKFGISVMFLKNFKKILNLFSFKTELHPAEVFLFNSIEEINPILKSVNFKVKDSYFGIRDLYTHYILVLEKINE